MRSILQKRTELCSYLDNTNCDVLALTETWLYPDITNNEVLPDCCNFAIYRKDRTSKRGGGVLLVVKKHIPSFLVDVTTPLELLWICITSKSSQYILGVCHRPPDSLETFISDFHNNLIEITAKFPKANILVIGDFNFPDIDWPNLISRTSETSKFIELTLDFSLEQLVNEPTRGSNILDLVFASAPETVNQIYCSDGFSDHKLLEFAITTSFTARVTIPKQIFDYKRADYDSKNRGLEEFCTSFLDNFSNRSVNDNWSLYKTKLLELIDAHIPRISFRVSSSKPWFNKKLRTLRNRKKRLFKVAKGSKTATATNNHRASEKAYCSAVRKAKQKYLSHDLQSLMTHNPKKFWRTISPPSTSDHISLCNDTGTPITQEACPLVFNDFFSEMFTKEDYSSIPSVSDVDYPFMSPIDHHRRNYVTNQKS